MCIHMYAWHFKHTNSNIQFNIHVITSYLLLACSFIHTYTSADTVSSGWLTRPMKGVQRAVATDRNIISA